MATSCTTLIGRLVSGCLWPTHHRTRWPSADLSGQLPVQQEAGLPSMTVDGQRALRLFYYKEYLSSI